MQTEDGDKKTARRPRLPLILIAVGLVFLFNSYINFRGGQVAEQVGFVSKHLDRMTVVMVKRDVDLAGFRAALKDNYTQATGNLYAGVVIEIVGMLAFYIFKRKKPD